MGEEKGEVTTVLLKEVLRTKGSHVYTIDPDASLQDAVEELVQHNIGALVVCHRDPDNCEKILGIITERDILRRCAYSTAPLREIRVSEVMSRNLITAHPSETVEQALQRMTVHRFRHLPVVLDGQLVGIVSIGDAVKAQLDHVMIENRFMKDYIQG
ncbi:MAG: CBS domain-containing protein [Thermogutta sp.]